MGLDMYLYKKNYVANKELDIEIKKGGEIVKSINSKKIAYIVEQVGYWRKANAIHKWFIKNCADGDGDKTTMDVQEYQLEELKEDCQRVIDGSKLVKGKISNGQTLTETGWKDILEDGYYIENPELARELLPTESGFFFGSTNYDEYYIEDLKHTIKIIDEALENNEEKGFYPEYEYQASW